MSPLCAQVGNRLQCVGDYEVGDDLAEAVQRIEVTVVVGGCMHAWVGKGGCMDGWMDGRVKGEGCWLEYWFVLLAQSIVVVDRRE